MIDWLMAGDPAIRWQVMRDLLDADPADVAAERARVAHEGWGARILDLQLPDGSWDGGAHFPADFSRDEWEREGQAWSSTSHALTELRLLGAAPDDPRVAAAVEAVAAGVRWEHDGQRYFDGEVEPCINGQLVALGAYFGRDVAPVVDRLVHERLGDGAWNCEAENGATVSSVDTTTDVLDGLGAWSRAHGRPAEVEDAIATGLEYLLERRLFRRLSTGEAIDPTFLELAFPHRWRHTVLRALDWMREDGRARDPRCEEAVEAVRAKRLPDGRWPLERVWRGRRTIAMEEAGEPSRWITLQAARVLRWWDADA